MRRLAARRFLDGQCVEVEAFLTGDRFANPVG